MADNDSSRSLNETFGKTITRKVWESSNGTRLLTVTDLLSVGEYEIKKETTEDGAIVLECTPLED